MSTLIVIAISLAFLLYNLVNLPFTRAYQNYRANICHLTQFVVLFTSMYYRSMKSNRWNKTRKYVLIILSSSDRDHQSEETNIVWEEHSGFLKYVHFGLIYHLPLKKSSNNMIYNGQTAHIYAHVKSCRKKSPNLLLNDLGLIFFKNVFLSILEQQMFWNLWITVICIVISGQINILTSGIIR